VLPTVTKALEINVFVRDILENRSKKVSIFFIDQTLLQRWCNMFINTGLKA